MKSKQILNPKFYAIIRSVHKDEKQSKDKIWMVMAECGK